MSAFGNLKEAAAKPGPGAYNVPSALRQDGAGAFGKGQRTLTTDARTSAVYADAIGKERAFAYRTVPEDDALDELVAQHAAPSALAAAAPEDLADQLIRAGRPLPPRVQ